MTRTVLILGTLFATTSALFFGSSGGGGGCCCGCGTPQPPSCGCTPMCPAPAPCPACPPPPVCPPPPTAYCPQVNPVYVPASSPCGGGGGGSCGGGGGSSCGGGGSSCGGGGGFGGAAGGFGGIGGGYGGGAGGGGGGGYQQSPIPPAPVHVAPSGFTQSSSGQLGGGLGGGGGYAAGPQSIGPIPPPPPAPAGGPFQQVAPSSSYQEVNKPCTPTIKYVMLRSKKVLGAGNEEVLEEELEQAEKPNPVESTASPLDLNPSQDLNADDDYDSPVHDAKCNSEELRSLINDNIAKDDALASKRQIHEASIKKFSDATVDVICSTTGFTYLVSTTEHCEQQKDNVICFVYKRPL